MKRKTNSFTGERPIFTGSPSIVQGGFNLDVAKQHFNVGDVIPAGTLAIYDEQTRLVSVLKTAKVVEIGSDDHKIVHLMVDEFYAPFFAVGDKVAKAGAISGTFDAAVSITKIEAKNESYIITLSGEISGLAKNDVLVEVVNSSSNAAEIGEANAVTIYDVYVNEFETGIDVCADTMQYAMYERRVPPIPASQKDTTGKYLKANPHVKLTQSF
nr:MAG: head fiber protein [Bacteriophage sp.]